MKKVVIFFGVDDKFNVGKAFSSVDLFYELQFETGFIGK